jgi:phosphate transport system substrate-binding protein
MGWTWRNTSALLCVLAILGAACGNAPDDAGGGGDGDGATGSIDIDGSSTVAPLTDAIAEEYAAVEPDVTVNTGISGTGGGFERFCNGETQISNASRAIREDEVAACQEAGIEFTEVRVGTDALTVVTNPETGFVDCLTFDELARIFGAEVAADNWNEVREEFPDTELQVFAPGADSGTYDFFVEEVLGEDGEVRGDYNATENDDIIAQGVINEPGAWGFFGFAYFQESAQGLKALAVDNGESGCVEPSVETAEAGEYPLARPLFIYVRNDALADPAVADFVTFYLDTVNDVIEDVGYIPAPEDALAEARSRVEDAVGG